MDSSSSSSSYGTTSSGVSESASNSSKTSSSSGISSLFASPNMQLLTPPRSLFSLTPTPRTGSSSLFSVSPSNNPLSHQMSTPLAGKEQAYPSSAGVASTQNQESPNLLSTPPSVRSTTSSHVPAHNTGRYIPLAQRECVITPSPFKTPNFSKVAQNQDLDITPTISSPLTVASNTIRVLDFDEAVDRAGAKRPRTENECSNEQAIPEPKRTMMPWHFDRTQDTAIFRMHTLPIMDHGVEERDKSKNISQVPLEAHASSMATLSSTNNLNPPFSPQSRQLNTENSTNLQMVLSSSPAPRPTNLTSIATLSASVSPLMLISQDSNLFASEQGRIKSNDASSHSLGAHSPSSQPSSAISIFSSKQKVSATIGTDSKAGSAAASYSSFSAALAAQALLENTAEDKESPSELREVFSIETCKIAGAIEDLVSQVTETSDLVHQLNLHLQMANNEVLLMNSSLVTDERLKSLESFFTNTTLSN